MNKPNNNIKIVIYSRNRLVGERILTGLLIKITKKIKLQMLSNYHTLPYVKIGVQEKKLNALGWQCGILYKFR